MSTVSHANSLCSHVQTSSSKFLVVKEQIGQGTGVTKGDAGEAAAQAAYESLSRAQP